MLKALEALPEPFKAQLDNVVVQVEDWPEDDLLESLGMGPEETLFGYYEGSPLTEYGREAAGMRLPDRIYVFQKPIEEVCEDREEIVEEIQKTIMHEVGHHFGLNEEELEHL